MKPCEEFEGGKKRTLLCDEAYAPALRWATRHKYLTTRAIFISLSYFFLCNISVGTVANDCSCRLNLMGWSGMNRQTVNHNGCAIAVMWPPVVWQSTIHMQSRPFLNRRDQQTWPNCGTIRPWVTSLWRHDKIKKKSNEIVIIYLCVLSGYLCVCAGKHMLLFLECHVV